MHYSATTTPAATTSMASASSPTATVPASMVPPTLAQETIRTYTPYTSVELRKFRTWEMSDFGSRLISYSRIVSPLNLFKTTDDIRNAQALLRGDLPLDVPAGETREISPRPTAQQLHEARQLVDSAVHPETGAIIPPLFRRSAFTVFNTPLFFAIAVTPQTTPWIVAWQAVNQTYNAFANYSNRSSEEEGGIYTLIQNFGLAITAATAAAVGTKSALGSLQERYGFGKSKGFIGPVITRFAPAFVAGVSASALNMLIVRRGELEEGVVVRSEPLGDAESFGQSQIAAKKALSATLQSRCLLPIASLVFPPLTAAWLAQKKGFLSRSFVRFPIVLGVVFASQLLSMPLSLAPWEWFMKIPVSELEPEIQEAARAKGLEYLYFNKGF